MAAFENEVFGEITMTKHLLAGLLVGFGFAFAGFAAAEQVYKWVDSKGVTHYGGKPPSGRKFQVVDATPTGYVHAIGGKKPSASLQDEGQQLATQQAVQRAASPPTRGTGGTLDVAVSGITNQPLASPRRGMSLETFRKLSVDTPEGEVLVRAGPPDYESNQFLSSGYLGKTWYYLPTPSDPFTTVIEIQGGTVFSLDRVRQF
jgi:hypothetical protein